MTKHLGKPPEQDREYPGSRRDPEERPVANSDELKEKTLDKTLADSFPTSDPPSTIPNPGDDGTLPDDGRPGDAELTRLPAGTWAAVSIDDGNVVGTGASRDEAENMARRNGHGKLSLQQVSDGTAAD